MRKIISFMHVSLDGFVAGPHGEMNWIKFDDELFDYIHQRVKKTDTSLYGRVTYELMESYWPAAADKPNATKHDIDHASWYKKVHKLILSGSMKGQALENATIISHNLPARFNEIKQQEGSEILLFGSPTATHSLMQEGLIDGFWLFINPIILGKGIPLFNNVSSSLPLKLLPTTRQFKCGVTELNYELLKF